MLIANSPSTLRPFLARHGLRDGSRDTGTDLCELVNDGLSSDEATRSLLRAELPGEARCAGSLRRAQDLVTALLAIAKRKSPNGLGATLSVQCLPTHISVTVTSDRVAQTAELGPLFEAFNAYSASLAKRGSTNTYTPRMKIVACADRRLSRVRIGLPHAGQSDCEAHQTELASYPECLRAG